ncbi:MAG: prepilin peptidase [Candidatus Moraniibacteriota bacterium]|nr:MAG: prepilin peptidase [Candidatus Moranbacteria bacterium]
MDYIAILKIAFLGMGLIVGSFLNAVLWRMKEGIGLGGRSMCPSCRATIFWYDNIPVISFLLLAGKCRACHVPISPRYPLVELLTAGLFLLIGKTFFVPDRPDAFIETLLFLGASSILILIFFFDLDTMEIPNVLLWFGVGWTLPLLLLLDSIRDSSVASSDSVLHTGMLGALIGFFPLFFLSFVSKERWMGMGDGFLAFFLGLLVGWPGILIALLFSFTLGASAGILALLLGKKELGSEMPFGPFLIVGTFFAITVERMFPELLRMLFWFS